MKALWKQLCLTALIAISGIASANATMVQPFANTQVTVKLVLGEGASLPGYQASNDTTIYHHNVVTYTANSDSTLPTPTKPGTTFVSWVFAQSSALVRVNRMPRSSGAVYYAYWQGDGTLATTITSVSSSSSASSASIPSSSMPPTTSIVSSTSDTTPTPTSIYLKANQSPVNWPDAGARLYLYFWEAPINVPWPGVAMTSLGNGLYRHDLNFSPTKLLFVRLHPTTLEEWNKTPDLTYVSPNNLFTLTSWNDGVWSVYQAAGSSSETTSSAQTTTSEISASSSLISQSSSVSSSSSVVSASSTLASSSEVMSSSTPSSSMVSSSSEIISSSPSPSMSTTSSEINPSSSSEVVSSSSTMVSSSNPPTSSSDILSSSQPVASSEGLSSSASAPSSSIVVSSSSDVLSSSQTTSMTTTSSEMVSSSSSEVISSSSSITSSSEVMSASSSDLVSTSLPSSAPSTYAIYLYVNHPNVNWGAAGATFSIYYWGNGIDANPWPGKALTNLGNGYYRFVFESIAPTHLLFVRLDPNTGNVWNQTIDYQYPGENYMLTIDNWGDNFTDFKSVGFWSLYSA
jgi:hypothetical protein